MGTSYSGATQHALAIAGAPNLAAMVPVDAMSNVGRYGVRHNGAFELRWLNWILTLGNATGIHATATGADQTPNGHAAAMRAASTPDAVAAIEEIGPHIRDYAAMLPLRPGATPLKFAPEYEAWLTGAIRHGDNDSFWKDAGSGVVDHLKEYKDVPVYHLTGWYDSWAAPVANLNYVELTKTQEEPAAAPDRPVDPRRPGGQFLRYCGVRASRGHQHERTPSPLVRPLAEGYRERSRSRSSRPPFCYGLRRSAQDPRRQTLRRRPVAG